ncbi:hypothetical protein CC78DRAFT_581955 [Lojkania enalia]|uniref:Uncharacterized protein n=1 Tax=Lojkania enalia TaxID=147567 RepID=A0A9P4K8M0_9PLEO|nr:hypothetical protein CC78DRAFT_581955 [Didymosphaeria enalia]
MSNTWRSHKRWRMPLSSLGGLIPHLQLSPPTTILLFLDPRPDSESSIPSQRPSTLFILLGSLSHFRLFPSSKLPAAKSFFGTQPTLRLRDMPCVINFQFIAPNLSKSAVYKMLVGRVRPGLDSSQRFLRVFMVHITGFTGTCVAQNLAAAKAVIFITPFQIH